MGEATDRDDGRWLWLGLALAALLVIGTILDRASGWITPAFDAVAHLFYEIPVLAQIRRPSQLVLVRAHLAILLALVPMGCLAAPRVSAHGRIWWAIFCVGYAIRATAWIAGGNLPLVPGDSCHYLEVASSVWRGEGPVKHYVESYFADYPAIRQGRGVLDDWATPLWAYVLAGVYRLTGIEPGRSLEQTVAVAKATSFVLNLLCLPALYFYARRRIGPRVALGAMAALAVLPVHAIYAGFALRESLVALTSILSVWWLTEIWSAKTSARARWIWAVAAGAMAGMAILARNTALALMAAAGLYALFVHGRRHLGPLVVWGLVLLATIAPWAWATYQEYGEPFYTYTKYFPYNFSWTVHHYDRGNTHASEFYTAANAPTIVRVKIKSLFIIAVYSVMIASPALVLGLVRRLRWREPDEPPGARDVDRLAALFFAAFVLATLVQVADVTQVAQLGRYYLPVFVLALPPAVAGLDGWLQSHVAPRGRLWLAALVVPLLWADPTWAYDATWFVKPYQLHWPAIRAAGDWIRTHPEKVPTDARIMTWFPWELRLASQRTTILMPRSLEAGPYEVRRIEETTRQYGVTHFLWGSFEPSPHSDPEQLGAYLERLRPALGLVESNELYRSKPALPYPVRLYRLQGARP